MVDEARLARSIAEMEYLAAAISHDLKSPLATVTGCVQLLVHLEPERRGGADYDELLATIGAAVDVMRTLIDDLLAYAAAPETPLNLTTIDLRDLVGGVVAARLGRLGPGSGPRPAITVDRLPKVVGDPAMIRRVIENLIGNAVKYTAPDTPAEVRVSATRDEATGTVTVEVRDRGIGIPEGQHEAVFARYHRAHPKAGYPGTGLGLAICQRIIDRHGGQIGAAANPGGGTRFWFTLPQPASPRPGRHPGRSSQPGTPPSSSPR
ncbi:MAG: HAMP domain-containing histidine kinase [Micromonosporaceae bacterium]|nr:HAMP domain-containing histidine kinase [Micromonosporaceae bacterium]